ncbi:hypothetical protein MUA04_00820 [Enterobacteriaceae bacterium H11S18]|uniref:hypothetical protein n=1 Tax=Dryocola clanedunensis TaxID=2925396 RepID=UPI0022F0D563|nr:hypothetical protein [Dryocola clanedunensis]MCT4708779.1 hypothetical protein [Dryocola clanedunensis]
MSMLKKAERRISFLGQNSHGADDAWYFRHEFLHKIPSTASVAVVMECPTVDLILYSLKRDVINDSLLSRYLASSTYWWMRSVEFHRFMMNLPRNTDIFGIDVPLSTLQHSGYISALSKRKLSVGSVLQSLLQYDIGYGEIMATVSPENRENLLEDKLSVILEGDYSDIVVICHNFHATRHSWLPYRSLCQALVEKSDNTLNIKSCGIFSEQMFFIATPDGRSLSEFYLRDACIREKDYFRVKMVSSFFRCEERDALPLQIRSPLHFDEIIVFPAGNPITMDSFYE